MHRVVASLLAIPLLCLGTPGPAAAQSDTPQVYQSDAPHVYQLYLEIDFADVPAWVEFYRNHEVPVFEELVDEGVLSDFGLWVHEAGGRYNVRYNIVTPNWAALGDYGDAYWSRVDAEALAEMAPRIRQHDDQIWTIYRSDFPDGWRDAPITYEAAYQLDLGTLPQWEAANAEYGVPALEQAVDQGQMVAWAVLRHAAGGPYDVKTVYWLESWDAADDAIAFMVEARGQMGMDPDDGPVMLQHRDDIWRTVPRR